MSTSRRTPASDTGRLDWSHAPVRDAQPCVACGKPAFLRHPVTGRPHHKVCDPTQQAVGE